MMNLGENHVMLISLFIQLLVIQFLKMEEAGSYERL